MKVDLCNGRNNGWMFDKSSGSRYEDGAGNTVEENSRIFSLIRMY